MFSMFQNCTRIGKIVKSWIGYLNHIHLNMLFCMIENVSLCVFVFSCSFNLSISSFSWNTLWFGSFFIWTVLYCWLKLDLYLQFWSVFYYIFLYECLSIHNVVGSIYFYSKTNNRQADSTSIKNSVHMCIGDVMIARPSKCVHVSILNELWIANYIWITNNIWMVKIFKAWKIWCVSAMLCNLWIIIENVNQAKTLIDRNILRAKKTHEQ